MDIFERDFRNQHILDLEQTLLNYEKHIGHQAELIVQLQKQNKTLKYIVYKSKIIIKRLLIKYIFPNRYKKTNENDAVESLINLNKKRKNN